MPKTLVLLYCKCSIIFCGLVKRKKKDKSYQDFWENLYCQVHA